jgi:hypothetical protein
VADPATVCWRQSPSGVHRSDRLALALRDTDRPRKDEEPGYWKDYAQGNQWRTMSITAMEFLRRFAQHILPRGFVRIRQFGYLASNCRTARLALARHLLRRPTPLPQTSSTTPAWHCPRCGALMVIGRILSQPP